MAQVGLARTTEVVGRHVFSPTGLVNLGTKLVCQNKDNQPFESRFWMDSATRELPPVQDCESIASFLPIVETVTHDALYRVQPSWLVDWGIIQA